MTLGVYFQVVVQDLCLKGVSTKISPSAHVAFIFIGVEFVCFET